MPVNRGGVPWWTKNMKQPAAQAPSAQRAGMGDLRRFERAQAGGGIPLQNRGTVVNWDKMREVTPPQDRQTFRPPFRLNVNAPQVQVPPPQQNRETVMQGMGGAGDILRRLRATAGEFFPGVLPTPAGGPAARAFRMGGVTPQQPAEPYMQAPWWWSRYVYPGGGGY